MPEGDNILEASVYLAPPGNGMESDEDSDTEEGYSADHLSSRQLNAPAEFVINYGSDNVNSLDEEADSGDEQVGLEESMNEGENLHPMITLSSQPPPTIDYKWLKKNLKSKMFPGQPTQRHFKDH